VQEQFVVQNDELLLSIVKIFVQCSGALHATGNARCLKVCGNRTDCRSHQQPSSGRTLKSTPWHTPFSEGSPGQTSIASTLC